MKNARLKNLVVNKMDHGLEEEGDDDEKLPTSDKMSNTTKVLIGLAGATVAASLIAAGVYYPMKVLNRKRFGSKRKKNRRSKRKK